MDASTGNLSFLHHDAIGSVVATTDNTGNLANVFAYSPFGESSPLTGTTFGYTGQRFDPESSLYYFKARYYNPTIGRFHQPDPAGYPANLNLYQYADNEPLDLIDPTGLFVKATYSQTAHRFTAVDVDTGQSITSDNIFSGNTSGNPPVHYENRPEFQLTPDHGPIPQDTYDIQPKAPITPRIPTDPNAFWYPLQGHDPKITKIRNGFTIHPGLHSNGCITYRSDIPEGQQGYPHNADFDKLSNMLEHTKPQYTKNGSKILGRVQVIP